MLKKYKDVFSGSFLLLIAIVTFTASFSIKRITVSKIGSAFVPQVISILFAIVAITIIYNGFKGVKEFEGLSVKEEKKDENSVKAWAVISTFLMITVYVALLDTLGFIITTALYLFVQFNILSDKKFRKLPVFGLVAVATSVVIYYIFVSAFQLMLPAGILG